MSSKNATGVDQNREDDGHLADTLCDACENEFVHAEGKSVWSEGSQRPIFVCPNCAATTYSEPSIELSAVSDTERASLPSSRPMTLRQQLAHSLLNFGEHVQQQTLDGMGWRGLEPTEHLLELFERYGQEIAREARLDELRSIVGWRSGAKDAVLIRPEFRHRRLIENVDSRRQMLVTERIAELTQKPPQPDKENT